MRKPIGKILQTVFYFALLAVVSGCAGVAVTEKVTYSGIKPEYPMPFAGFTDVEVIIDSLTPTLKWQAKEGIKEYDIAVWDSPFKQHDKSFKQIMEDSYGTNRKDNDPFSRRPEERGERVFYAKQITGTSVTVTPELKPDHFYLWSVRASGTEEWSTYRQYDWLSAAALQPQHSKGHSYKFYTPKAAK